MTKTILQPQAFADIAGRLLPLAVAALKCPEKNIEIHREALRIREDISITLGFIPLKQELLDNESWSSPVAVAFRKTLPKVGHLIGSVHIVSCAKKRRLDAHYTVPKKMLPKNLRKASSMIESIREAEHTLHQLRIAQSSEITVEQVHRLLRGITQEKLEESKKLLAEGIPEYLGISDMRYSLGL